jgi:hypothetical protein
MPEDHHYHSRSTAEKVLRSAMIAASGGEPIVVGDFKAKLVGCALVCRTTEEAEALHAQLVTYLKRTPLCGSCGQVLPDDSPVGPQM